MNENIDLTKILEGCPKWTPFYSQVFGDVFFIRIEACLSGKYILFSLNDHGVFSVDSKGKYANGDNPKDIECIIFPSKDQRDWSKFTASWYKKDKFNPKTLKPFDKIIACSYKQGTWDCGLFSFIEEDKNLIKCCGACYKYCIPYNDDTKHLVGTNDEAPEYYRYWEE